ncbi:MAG: hypothetical protein ABI743_04470, partial [bacterium]
FNTIPEGLAAVTAGGTVCLEPATTPYPMFSITANKSLVGYDRGCGNLRPTIAVNAPATIGSNLTNTNIERLIFNLNIPAGSGSDILIIDVADNLTLRDNRFTGTSLRPDNNLLALQNIDNSLFRGNEFVNLTFTGAPGPSGRNQNLIYLREGIGINQSRLSFNDEFTQNEFHNLGYPSTASDAGQASRMRAMVVTGSYFDFSTSTNYGTKDIKIRNNLFYNFFDHTTGATTNADHNDLEVLYLGGCDALVFANNTFDNFDVYNGTPSQAGAMKGFYSGGWITPPAQLKNNIWKSTIWYQGPLIFHWSAGFWKDGDGPHPMSYSCVYWGNPAPACGSCQVSSFLNMITKGTGSYDMFNLVDPNFNYTPGANYYHPQNNTIKTGADDGSEMGAFGGPSGSWTPPSQFFP